jgi:hypothetical protein
MASLRGGPLLADFWDYTCVNSIRTLPYVSEWHRRYSRTDSSLSVRPRRFILYNGLELFQHRKWRSRSGVLYWMER